MPTDIITFVNTQITREIFEAIGPCPVAEGIAVALADGLSEWEIIDMWTPECYRDDVVTALAILIRVTEEWKILLDARVEEEEYLA